MPLTCAFGADGGHFHGLVPLRALSALDRSAETVMAGALVGVSALGAVYWQDRLPSSRVDTVESFWGLTVSEPGESNPVLFQPARRRAWILGRPAYDGPLDDIALKRSPQASGTLYGVEESSDVIRRRMLRYPELTVLRDRPGRPQDQTPAEITKRAVLHQYFRLCWVIPMRGGEWTTYVRRDHAATDPLCAPGRDIHG